MARVLLAFDKKSARSFDADGRMRVRDCILSTAEINPYHGREIPGWQKLGLDPNRVYELYREPEELARAVETFNGNPLMVKHVAQTADEPRKEHQAGSVHSVRFDGKHLRGDLLVSDRFAIDLIETDALSDLSCGYRYEPDMTSGSKDGSRYDGIMRNIAGNHVALVDDGRASGAHVADAALKPTAGASTMHDPVNPQAAAPAAPPAAPAAAAPATPAPDMAAIGQALKSIAELLGEIHAKVGGAAAPAAAAPAAPAAAPAAAAAEEPKPGGAADFDLTAATEGNEGSFNTEGANDEEPGVNQPANYSTGTPAPQEGTTARGNATPTDLLDQGGESAQTTGAMDAKSVQAVVAAAVKAERARAAGVAEAARETRGVLGEVYGMDDAGAIYREALGQVGVDVAAVPKGTEKAAWQAFKAVRGVTQGAGRRPGDTGSSAHAMDAKAVEANQSNIVQLLGKVRILG